MGVISFQPIQPGTGEPSPHNRRPIYAPLNIDGIGKIWGGELNTNTATITATWNGIVLDGVNGKVNTQYLTDLTIRAGVVYLPNTKSGEMIPAGISVRREYVLTDSIPYMNELPDDPLPYWYLPQTGRLYVVVAVAYREDYPDITTKNQCITFVNEWLTEHPTQFVYLLTPSFYTTYHLTTAQLNQAMSQLGVPISSMQEVMHQIAMDSPHLITTTPTKLHTFSTNMVAPLKECKVHFSPVQEGTPSRGNPLPISGWTGFTFYRCGKNLTLAKDGTTMLTLPNYTSANKGDIIRGFPTDEDFVLSCKVSTGIGVNSSRRLYLYGITTSNKFLNTGIIQDGSNKVVNKPTELGTLVVWHNRNGLNDVGEYLYDIQLERGTTPTEYEEYNGIRQEIDWTSIGEIPGGYEDLVNGVLVQTWRLLKINQQGWSYNSSRGFFMTKSLDAVGGTIPICSCYGYNYGGDKSVSTTSDGRRVIIDSSFEGDVDAMLNAVGEEYICWQTKTPITYQLDPVTLKTLRGLNNIWSTANGNIDLSYWKH